jgi:hypothetical protein
MAWYLVKQMDKRNFNFNFETFHGLDPMACFESEFTSEIICPYRRFGIHSAILKFDSRRGLGIFLFIANSGSALGPTQLPIQWIKRPGREADHSPPSSAEVKE